MIDTVRTDVRIAPAPVKNAGQSLARSRVRRLKRLGSALGDAWREIMQGMQAAREDHPVISAYRPR